MKKTTLEEVTKQNRLQTYEATYNFVMEQIALGNLKPIKSAGTNGKRPALCNGYWIVEEQKDYSQLVEELKFIMVPQIDITYYLSHLAIYEKERVHVLALNTYLREQSHLLAQEETNNERSFEIWKQEKFLTKSGESLLKHCGMTMDDLHCKKSAEPMIYYTCSRKVPQNILIIENQDTFYSMWQYLIAGHDRIMGMEIGTLIYGSGKKIERSFSDFCDSVEPYMRQKENHVYYFGDLDYEGIGIYERLSGAFAQDIQIIPFEKAYRMMMQKAFGIDSLQKDNTLPFTATKRQQQILETLPLTKEKQNRNISGEFFTRFSDAEIDLMKYILESGRYIPQEILNQGDFSI